MFTILSWLSPPFLGAFIGYLTNRVAIRMLFRPLKPWHLFGRRLPMTPGVIPAKRHELAANIGEMVGEHLLTGAEISRAINGEAFQQHLHRMIDARVTALLYRDLGPLPTLVPDRFILSFTKGARILRRRFLKQVRGFVGDDRFARTLNDHLGQAVDDFLGRDLGRLLDDDQRTRLSRRFGEMVRRLVDSATMEAELDLHVEQLLRHMVDRRLSLNDLLPVTAVELGRNMVVDQIPGLLSQLASLLDDEAVRGQFSREMTKAIEGFVASLGPLGAMAGSFLTPKFIESKVNEYLVSHRHELGQLVTGDSVRQKMTDVALRQLDVFWNTPVAEFLEDETGEVLLSISRQCSSRLAGLLRSDAFVARLVHMIEKSIDEHVDTPLSEVLGNLLGDSSVRSSRDWLVAEVSAVIQSDRVKRMLDQWLSDLLEERVLNRPVGMLADLLPADVRNGICGYIMKLTGEMLVSEVPSMLDSLDIRQLVVRKVDSLDLLQLERLLLSIMEEQFKYINLFGALLGFMLGCLNLFFLLLR